MNNNNNQHTNIPTQTVNCEHREAKGGDARACVCHTVTTQRPPRREKGEREMISGRDLPSSRPCWRPGEHLAAGHICSMLLAYLWKNKHHIATHPSHIGTRGAPREAPLQPRVMGGRLHPPCPETERTDRQCRTLCCRCACGVMSMKKPSIAPLSIAVLRVATQAARIDGLLML